MNCRLNPTANGDASMGVLHLGHVYMALINERIAHNSGGRFTVRFDDNQLPWIELLGTDAIAANCKAILSELDWLGIPYDDVVYQSELEPLTHQLIKRTFGAIGIPKQFPHVPKLVRDAAPQYPYTPWLTSEVVICDNYSGVNMLIAGDELMGRYALYCWMAERLGLPIIPHVYLPRVKAGGEMDEVSKTRGNYKVATYKARGYPPDLVIQTVARAALIDPRGGWTIENVKPAPNLAVPCF